MKINSIEIKNFRGITELKHDFTKPVTILTGKVGTGKTSFIQALKFGYTNELPFNPVKAGTDEAIVSLACENDLNIKRGITNKNKKSASIMGRKSGISASESFLEEATSVSNNIMKIATSSDTLGLMKSEDFGNLFLTVSTETKEFKEVIDIILKNSLTEKDDIVIKPATEGDEFKLTPAVTNKLKELFPDKNITLESINKAYETAKSDKKDIDANVKYTEAKSKDFTKIVKPEWDRAELNTKLEEIIGVENNVKNYKEIVEAYNNALLRKKEQDKKIASLEMDIAMSTAIEPDPNDLKSMKDQKKKANDDIISNSKVLQTMTDHLSLFERTLAQLDKPVCPISEKLICSTDKTGLRSELENEVKDTKISISVINGKINDLKTLISDIDERIFVYEKNKEKWDKKVNNQKMLDDLLKNPVKVPKRPEKIEFKTDYKIKKAEIKEKIATLDAYEEAEKNYLENQRLKKKQSILKFIIKMLDSKGPVVTEYIDTFMECLEDACNERARILKTDFEVKFIAENGLKALFKTKAHSEFLPYTSLSSGERIMASLLLTDLINSFYNSRILILDDTDHLDAENFRLLLNFVDQGDITDYYDNIIISCDEHDDMLDVIDDFDVDVIKM